MRCVAHSFFKKRHKNIMTYFCFHTQTDTEFASQYLRHKNIRAYLIFTQRARNYMYFCSYVKDIYICFHAKTQRARSYMYFCSSVKNYCTQTAQKHVDALRNFAALREKNMFLCQKYSCTQNSQKYTEFASQFFRHKNIRAYFLGATICLYNLSGCAKM